MKELESRLNHLAADLRRGIRETSFKDMDMGLLLRMRRSVRIMFEALESEIRAVIKFRSSDSEESDSASSDMESLGGEDYVSASGQKA